MNKNILQLSFFLTFIPFFSGATTDKSEVEQQQQPTTAVNSNDATKTKLNDLMKQIDDFYANSKNWVVGKKEKVKAKAENLNKSETLRKFNKYANWYLNSTILLGAAMTLALSYFLYASGTLKPAVFWLGQALSFLPYIKIALGTALALGVGYGGYVGGRNYGFSPKTAILIGFLTAVAVLYIEYKISEKLYPLEVEVALKHSANLIHPVLLLTSVFVPAATSYATYYLCFIIVGVPLIIASCISMTATYIAWKLSRWYVVRTQLYLYNNVDDLTKMWRDLRDFVGGFLKATKKKL